MPKLKIYTFGSSIKLNQSLCIGCGACVNLCKKQQIGFYELTQIDNSRKTQPVCDKNIDCIYCGQCTLVCPVKALTAVGEYDDSENPFLIKDKTIVVQFAPSIRSSIGELFGLPAGQILTSQLVAALRQLGAHKVFDVSLGADFTTIEESAELIERLEQNKNLPLFTACCPAWVKFIEFYYPEFIPNLTNVRSPHIISGGLTKTYWAEYQGLNPADIFVISIMPCTAKKYEITRPELKINGISPVDKVLTTRELGNLIKQKKIDLGKIKGEMADNPFGEYSGAGVIYGASGGVMESALRSVYRQLSKSDLPKTDFTETRGLATLKKTEVKVSQKTIKAGIVNGLTEARTILAELKTNPSAYDYIEFMACHGGCIGGGGQPFPVTDAIRQARANALYTDDANKKIRIADDNPAVIEIYQQFFNQKEKINQICYTKYNKIKHKNICQKH